MFSATLSCGRNTGNHPVTPSIDVPSGLSQEDSIAYIENERYKDVTVTAEDLLGLGEIHTLYPYENRVMTRRDSAALQQMNRLMRMQYVAAGNPDSELAWAEAVNRSLGAYCKEFDISKKEALEDLLESVSHYAYCALICDIQDAKLRKLLMSEYRAWNRLNRERHNVYVNVQHDGEHYSSQPMDFEERFEAYANKRLQDLSIERAILLEDGAYSQQHPVVRSAEWDAYLKNPLWWPVDCNEESSEDENVKMIVRFKKNVQDWLDVRHSIKRALPPKQEEAYDRLTADYHWVIVNEADGVDPNLF